MKISRLFLPTLLAILCIACKNDPKQTAVSTAAPTPGDPVAMAKKAAYICPMDCEQGKLYEQAGTCPVCKMDLEVAKADQIRHAATEQAVAEQTNNLAADDPNKALEAEINVLHDETMKEMAEMERVGRQVKEDFKMVKDAEERKPYTLAIAEISRAGMNMMAWMRDYRSPKDLPAAEATRYMTEQRTKMQHIRADIQKATTDGQKLKRPLK